MPKVSGGAEGKRTPDLLNAIPMIPNSYDTQRHGKIMILTGYGKSVIMVYRPDPLFFTPKWAISVPRASGWPNLEYYCN